jgi:hypothetical protein
MNENTKMWFVLGAGVSAGPPSNLSLWGEISRDTRQFLCRTVEHKVRASGGDGYWLAKAALGLIGDGVWPETVLECLSRVYGRTRVSDELRSLLSPAGSGPNACHRAVARLAKNGRVAGVLTTNFDTLLEKALDAEQIPCHVLTTPRLEPDGRLPLIKIHGTIVDTSSLAFTRNEYFLGLSSAAAESLQSQMAGSILVVAGYGGNDIDVFPLIRSMIQRRRFAKVTVVDPTPLASNRRFHAIRDFIEYHNAPAELFLCELAGMPHPRPAQRQRGLGNIMPRDDKYSAALFFGDCLLALGLDNGLAHSLFFLTQDIVEEETGDQRQLAITLLAKGYAQLAMGDTARGEMEYSAGRNLLHTLLTNRNVSAHRDMLSEFGGALAGLETEADIQRRFGASGFMSGCIMPRGPDAFGSSDQELLRTVLYWELRTRIRLCFSALAAASTPGCSTQQQNDMLALPAKLMSGFHRWQQYFPESKPADELPLLPPFYSDYFATYRRLLAGDRGSAAALDDCARTARRSGFYLGVGQCFFLKQKAGLELSTAERDEYAAIQELCGVDEERVIAPLFRPCQPFELTITRYEPPIKDIRDASV